MIYELCFFLFFFAHLKLDLLKLLLLTDLQTNFPFDLYMLLYLLSNNSNDIMSLFFNVTQ